MKELVLKVSGMMCSGCENRVKNALNSIEGVQKVEANHNDGIVKVSLKENIEKSIIEEIITDLGFDIVKED